MLKVGDLVYIKHIKLSKYYDSRITTVQEVRDGDSTFKQSLYKVCGYYYVEEDLVPLKNKFFRKLYGAKEAK